MDDKVPFGSQKSNGFLIFWAVCKILPHKIHDAKSLTIGKRSAKWILGGTFLHFTVIHSFNNGFFPNAALINSNGCNVQYEMIQLLYLGLGTWDLAIHSQ